MEQKIEVSLANETVTKLRALQMLVGITPRHLITTAIETMFDTAAQAVADKHDIVTGDAVTKAAAQPHASKPQFSAHKIKSGRGAKLSQKSKDFRTANPPGTRLKHCRYIKGYENNRVLLACSEGKCRTMEASFKEVINGSRDRCMKMTRQEVSKRLFDENKLLPHVHRKH